MKAISELFTPDIHTVAIAGHIGPDGDCVGTCLALYDYVQKNYPDISATVYLDKPKPEFSYLHGIDSIKDTVPAGGALPDLFIVLDVSTRDRIGVCSDFLDTAAHTVCIDHHVSNGGIAKINHIFPEVGSSSEVLYELLDPEKIDDYCAEALYTGIIHDTGVFQYSNTTPRTMEVAGELMKHGINFNKIIDESFNLRSYKQNQILGRTLLESMLMLDGRCIVGATTLHDMKVYGVEKQDLDGIVSQLRLTEGVIVAVYIYEIEPQTFKVSLRSNSDEIDVNAIASHFNGGGHKKAAGCTISGMARDVINNLMDVIAEEIGADE